MNENTFTVKFDVNGQILQEIKLKENINLSMEEFLENLRIGTIVTSIGHGASNGKVYLVGDSFQEIGEVVSQESLDDTEVVLAEDNFDLEE